MDGNIEFQFNEPHRVVEIVCSEADVATLFRAICETSQATEIPTGFSPREVVITAPWQPPEPTRDLRYYTHLVGCGVLAIAIVGTFAAGLCKIGESIAILFR